MTTITFTNKEELTSVVIKRARAIMGFRGLKNPHRVRVNVTSLGKHHRLEYTDDQLADLAKTVADDTLLYSIDYF